MKLNRAQGWGPIAAAGLAVLALGLGGCARPTGDFGRAAPGVLHDSIMPAMGASRAYHAGEPVSDLNLTDQEREMHDRVWRFLVAAHAHVWFYDTAVELQRTRLSGTIDTQFLADRYYATLRTTDYRSSPVRYRTVASDIDADIATIPGTFAAICRVIEVDRQRAVAVANVALGRPDGQQQVAARKWENDQKIAWFTRALAYRHLSYSTALDRLLVETPHEEARLVDARLTVLETYVRRAQGGDFCLSGAGGVVVKDTGAPSRYETGAPTLPVIRK